MDLSSVFGKKVGGFNKKGIWKPDIYWLKDSERLCFSQEEEKAREPLS